MDAYDYRPGCDYGAFDLYTPKLSYRNRKGQFVKGIILHNKGRKATEWASPEAIERMKAGLIHTSDNARKAQAISSQKSRKPVIRINPGTGEIVRYPSLGDAAKMNGGNEAAYTHIGRVCRQAKIRVRTVMRGREYNYTVVERTFHGYKFFFEKDTERWMPYQKEVEMKMLVEAVNKLNDI